jgi:hypothetical protein
MTDTELIKELRDMVAILIGDLIITNQLDPAIKDEYIEWLQRRRSLDMPITEQDRIDFGYYKLEREDAEVKEALTTYTIIEDERKRLTKFIGECFHKPGLDGYCTKCRMFIERGDGNREFTAPDDRQALCEKLMEKGLLNDFYAVSYEVYKANFKHFSEEIDGLGVFFTWILVEQPERCCKLCAQFIKENKT